MYRHIEWIAGNSTGKTHQAGKHFSGPSTPLTRYNMPDIRLSKSTLIATNALLCTAICIKIHRRGQGLICSVRVANDCAPWP